MWGSVWEGGRETFGNVNGLAGLELFIYGCLVNTLSFFGEFIRIFII